MRLSYKDDGNQNPIVTDSNDFYPFGMSFVRNSEEDAHFGAGSYYNYKYNGKELQETGMYDYGWRQYMPDLGRWYGMDQLGEHPYQIDKSPYAFTWNNPVNFVDPDGNCPDCPGNYDIGQSWLGSDGNWWTRISGGWESKKETVIDAVVVPGGSGSSSSSSGGFFSSAFLGIGSGGGGIGGGIGGNGGGWGIFGGGIGGVQSGSGTEISISYRSKSVPKFQHNGYEDAMKMIAGAEGAISTITSAKLALHNEVLRFNQNGAYKLSTSLTQMKNGPSYWNNNFVKAARTNHLAPLKTIGSKAPGGILVAADIALSGELKPSHAINTGMLIISTTGVGTVVAGGWFLFDNGYGLYNYINGEGFNTYSDHIDAKYGTYHLYNGIY